METPGTPFGVESETKRKPMAGAKADAVSELSQQLLEHLGSFKGKTLEKPLPTERRGGLHPQNLRNTAA